MKKPLATKILSLSALYCAVFCILVIIQFSNRGNFSLPVGGMTIRGNFLQEQQESESDNQGITGGIRIHYGGLEFSLRQERGKGLLLTENNDIKTAVNPEYMSVIDNIVRFMLPGGTTIAFNSLDSARGMELQISAEFAGNITEVTIPIIPRRSSLIRETGQLGIIYGGSRYVFSSLGQELEAGSIVLSRDNSFISYRSRGRQRAFDPADYIIAQEQNYANILRSWQDSSFAHWNQNASALDNEDDIIAYLSQSVQRGNYQTATAAVQQNFIDSPRHSFRSSGYIGGMTNAYSTFIASENEKMSLITRLTRARSLDILREEHIIDYLMTRNNLVLANEIIELVINAKPEMLIYDHVPGLLELFYDIRRWRPGVNNPIEHLAEQMLFLISDNLNRDTGNNLVNVSGSDGSTAYNSLRLGKALIYWAEANQRNEWAAIGRSLVISAVSTGNAGRLHNILKPVNYFPRAAWLTNEGHWAWTVSPSVRLTNIGGNMNIAVTFPVNMTHHLIIRGVRPFNSIQIHNMVWRSDPQFERYDSSGWIYYSEEQILIIRLRHRSTTENIRIIYRVEQPAPAPVPAEDVEVIVD